MLVEKEIEQLYYIALIHPSRESYVEGKFKDGLVFGKDSGNRCNMECVLFEDELDAMDFANYNLNSNLNYNVKKVGKENMKKISKLGLKEFKFYDSEEFTCKNCYMVKGLVKYSRNGKELYRV